MTELPWEPWVQSPALPKRKWEETRKEARSEEIWSGTQSPGFITIAWKTPAGHSKILGAREWGAT